MCGQSIYGLAESMAVSSTVTLFQEKKKKRERENERTCQVALV